MKKTSFFISILILGVVFCAFYFFLLNTIAKNGAEEKTPRHSIVEENEYLSHYSVDSVYVVKGEGTKVGFIRRINVERRKDSFIFSVFVPDTFKITPGQKVKLAFLECYTSDTQGQPNKMPQIKKILAEQ